MQKALPILPRPRVSGLTARPWDNPPWEGRSELRPNHHSTCCCSQTNVKVLSLGDEAMKPNRNGIWLIFGLVPQGQEKKKKMV